MTLPQRKGPIYRMDGAPHTIAVCTHGDTLVGWLSGQGAACRFLYMSTIDEIEHAVSGLSREELAEFRSWFLAFDAEAWDRQFEEDVAAGRLDALAEEALSDLRAGRTRPR